jgi:hypothetical protein
VQFKAAVDVPKLMHSVHTGCYCHNPPLKDSGTDEFCIRSEIYILTNTKGADIELRSALPVLTYLRVCYWRTLENFEDYVKSAVDKEIIMDRRWTDTGRNKKEDLEENVPHCYFVYKISQNLGYKASLRDERPTTALLDHGKSRQNGQHLYVEKCNHSHIHTYIDTHIHTHTYIHTYICTH